MIIVLQVDDISELQIHMQICAQDNAWYVVPLYKSFTCLKLEKVELYNKSYVTYDFDFILNIERNFFKRDYPPN